MGCQGQPQDISDSPKQFMARVVQVPHEEQKEQRYRQCVLMASTLGFRTQP